MGVITRYKRSFGMINMMRDAGRWWYAFEETDFTKLSHSTRLAGNKQKLGNRRTGWIVQYLVACMFCKRSMLTFILISFVLCCTNMTTLAWVLLQKGTKHHNFITSHHVGRRSSSMMNMYTSVRQPKWWNERDINELPYDSSLRALEAYHRKHGDLVIPNNFIVPATNGEQNSVCFVCI